MPVLTNDWNQLLESEFQKDYYLSLKEFLKQEYQTKNILPPPKDIFNAFKYTSYKDVKVLILGQDPYHTPGVAHGLSFSALPGNSIPPSLKNIYKELKEDLGINPPDNAYLKSWSDQGVLLLNAVLTVESSKPNSHKDKGWEKFTDSVIKHLNDKNKPIVFVLWGAYAQKKKELITNNIHYIITSAHPSPFSADKGFFGSKPFSKINNFLKKNNKKEINWN